MIFIYKNLFTTKNEAKGSPGGSSENRQDAGILDNLKRSPFASIMPKWNRIDSSKKTEWIKIHMMRIIFSTSLAEFVATESKLMNK